MKKKNLNLSNSINYRTKTKIISNFSNMKKNFTRQMFSMIYMPIATIVNIYEYEVSLKK
jgi:hypothetical protein